MYVLYSDRSRNISKMDVNKLDVLKTVEEIIGQLIVNGKPKQGKHKLQTLSFLSNLKIIHSQGLVTYVYMFYIKFSGRSH